METSANLARISENVRSARLAAGMDLESLALATGASTSHIEKIENGENHALNLSWLERASAALGVPLSRLLDLESKEAPGEKAADPEPKCRTCRYARPNLDGTILCGNHETTGHEDAGPGICDECPAYESRYIEYPITVNSIELDPLEAWDEKSIGGLVAVRPCSGNPEGRTYLGLYLGQQPWILSAAFHKNAGSLRIHAVSNPLIYVFETKSLVRGADSWWSRIGSPEDMRQITDTDIDKTWYVQLLRTMTEKKEK